MDDLGKMVVVEIQTLEQKNNHEKIFGSLGLEGKARKEKNVMGMGVLEGGMKSGRSSVMLVIGTPDTLSTDGFWICQLSADHLLALADAVKGAQERFKILRDKTIV